MRVSASNLHRAAACPGSTSLPWFGSESNEAASRGTSIHKFLETALNKGRDEALRTCDPEVLDACEVIDLDDLPAGDPKNWHAEVAFAYNWKTEVARIIGVGIGRNYGKLDEFEIAGCADVIRVVDDGDGIGKTVTVYDYKTGRGHVDPAEANWQLRLLGVAAASAYGALEADVGVIRLIDDTPRFNHAHYDTLDLAVARKQIRKVMEEAKKAEADVAAGKTPKLSTGAHCDYCPAIMSCKAVTGIVAAVAKNPAEYILDPVTLTPEQAGLAWVKIDIAIEGLKMAKKNLEQIAMSIPLPLPNGKVIASVETKRETITPDVTEAVMTELYGNEAASEAIEIKKSTSRTLLKSVVRAHLKPNEKLGKTYDAVLAEIRQAGGAKESFFYQIKEITPQSLTSSEDGMLRRTLPEAADAAREES